MGANHQDDRPDVPEIAAIELFHDRLGVWLSYAGAAYYQAYRIALKPLRLRPSWVAALGFIKSNSGVTQSGLGRLMAINRASAKALAMGLEEEGFISRTPAEGRNQTLLALTPEGATAFEQACDAEARLSDRLMASVNEERRKTLVTMLKDIHHEIGEAYKI